MRTALVLVCASGIALSAQAARTFKARLSPVPIDLTMQATVAGNGTATASLVGSKLTVSGTFEGLKSPATIARIHKSPTRGVRGPEIFTLTVTQATSGSISGTFDLTPAQVADVQNGRIYIQIHSEKAPDGNLWGWLLDKRP
jgi:CHRD domain